MKLSTTRCLIDSSFCLNFAINAVFSSFLKEGWFLKGQCSPDFEPAADQEFCAEVHEMLSKKIIDFLNHADFGKKECIFACDGRRSGLWRRELMPEYKRNRDDRDTSKNRFNIGKTLFHFRTTLIPALAEEFRGISVGCESVQADDIIAILTFEAAKAGHDVQILSGDTDMVQLAGDHVKIFNLRDEEMTPEKVVMKDTKDRYGAGYTADDYLLLKIIRGDMSDNIPNIRRGIGVCNAAKLVQDREQLKKLLKEDSQAALAFKRNLELISMKKIPEQVSSLIMEDYSRRLSESENG